MRNEISMFEKKLNRLQEQIFKMRGMLNAMKDLKERKYDATPQEETTNDKTRSGIMFDIQTGKRIK